jgi:predicted site-specific integrase-resolvase
VKAGIVSLVDWRAGVGVSSATCWRWRQKGWLKVTNIAGKNYITGEADAEFQRRATAGEFAKVPVVPRRKEAA